MAEEQIRVDVIANDEASKVVADVADAVDNLEHHDEASVTITADDREVLDDLDRIKKQVGLVDDLDATIDVKADTSAADRAMKGLDDKHHGKAIGESFVRDLTGSMGDQSAQLGGVFADSVAGIETTFDTLSSTIGGKVGATIGTLGSTFATAFGLGGVAFVAIDQLYTWWTHRNDDQKKAIEETYKLLKDEAGDAAAVLDKSLGEAMEKLNGKQRDALIGAGVNAKDLAAAVRGEAVPAIDNLYQKHLEYNAAVELMKSEGQKTDLTGYQAAQKKVRALQDEQNAWETVNGVIHDQGSALNGAMDKYNDLAKLMGTPVAVKLDTSQLDRQLADLTTRALNLGGLFRFNVTPSSVATASALDTRRQGPR